MNEREWVDTNLKRLTNLCIGSISNLRIETHKKLPYGYEVTNYASEGRPQHKISRYETDLLISERVGEGLWKPRIVVEAKMAKISTHAAIAYSKKANTHKSVHPYLRYGVFLADRQNHPLPGRLFRHGEHFDFMLSIRGLEASDAETEKYKEVLESELKASRDLEHIIYDSRKHNREKYTVLQRKLCLKR